jgi:hypothetical protein
MPKYNTFKYGKIAKYGKYDLKGVSGSVGEYIRYRVRYHDHAGNRSEYLTMVNQRFDVLGDTRDFRIREKNGEWVYTNHAQVEGKPIKIRMRSIESDGGRSPWLYTEMANLNEI